MDGSGPRSELQELQVKAQQVTDEVNLFLKLISKHYKISFIVYTSHDIASCSWLSRGFRPYFSCERGETLCSWCSSTLFHWLKLTKRRVPFYIYDPRPRTPRGCQKHYSSYSESSLWSCVEPWSGLLDLSTSLCALPIPILLDPQFIRSMYSPLPLLQSVLE